MCSDVKLTRGRGIFTVNLTAFGITYVFEGTFKEIHLEGGWHHPMECGPRLNKKEDIRWAKTFISLLPDGRQCGWPPHASVQIPSLLWWTTSPHTVSQTKRGRGERETRRRQRWWRGEKKNYKLLKKNYELNFIKINNVCTLKDDYQEDRSNT